MNKLSSWKAIFFLSVFCAGTTIILPAQTSGFWAGSYSVSTCNSPGYVGSGNPCSYIVWSLGFGAGGFGSNTAGLYVGPNQPNNVRYEQQFDGEFCSAGSGVDLSSAGSWADTEDLSNVFLSGAQSTTLTFTVTQRTPTLVSGTFAGSFAYPSSSGTAEGQITGHWSLTPLSAAFPKCITNGYEWCYAGSNYAGSNGTAVNALSGAGGTGSCPFLYPTAPAPAGEWTEKTVQITAPSQLSIGAGLPYQGTFTATGGASPYTWCVLSGSTCDPNPSSPASLPTGFSLDSATGVLSSTGTPIASANTYPFTVQATDSGGNIATQALTLVISCPVNELNPVPTGQSANGLPDAITATFVPPNGETLSFDALACGFSGFDWSQTVTQWPTWDGNPYSLLDAANNPGVPLTPPFSDPPLGLYTFMSYDPQLPKNEAIAYPFYYSPLDLASGCALTDLNTGHCNKKMETNAYTLNFFDSPRSPQCNYPNSCMAFTTELVGVCDSTSLSSSCNTGGPVNEQGEWPSLPLYKWTWMSNVSCIAVSNGFCVTSGEVSVLSEASTLSIYHPPLGATSGGVAITSINGVPSPTLSIDPSASTILVLQPLSVGITVGQFKGKPVPAGTVTLTSGPYTSSAATLDGNGDANITVPAGSLPVGSDMLAVAYTPATSVSATYSQAWGTAMVTVTLPSQTISFGPIAAQLVGATVPLNATASSGLTVAFQSLTPTVCSVSQTTATALSPGTCTIEATQSGGTGYSPANPVDVSFVVSYAVCLLYDPTKATQSGSTIPLKIQLCNAKNADVSSSGIVVNGVSLVQTSTNASSVLQSSSNANPDNDFRFDPTLGPTGGYIFNLSTKGLTTGSYQLTFTAGADPVPHVLSFQVR